MNYNILVLCSKLEVSLLYRCTYSQLLKGMLQFLLVDFIQFLSSNTIDNGRVDAHFI